MNHCRNIMMRFILFISCIHLSSSQISYNSNPYSAYFDPSSNQYVLPFGSYNNNIEYPTNQIRRRIYIPGVENFRPGFYSYFRNDQSNGTSMTTTSENWNQEGPTKYNLFSYPTNTFQNGGLNIGLADKNQDSSVMNNNSPSEVSNNEQYLGETVNSWSQIPVYLTNSPSVQTNSPELTQKSFDMSGYPYTTRTLQLLNNQNTDFVSGSLNPSTYYQTDFNREIPSSNPIALPYLIQQRKLSDDSPNITAKKVSNPLLYYYKNPGHMSNLIETSNPNSIQTSTLEMSLPSIEPSLGSIVSPFLTTNTNSKHSGFQMISTDLEMSKPTNNKYTTNSIQEPNPEVSPYQVQNTKSDSIRQSLLSKESNPTTYYQNNNQNTKSEETKLISFPNQKTTFGNVDSLMSDSILGTINPIIYYSTDYQNYNPVGTSSYLIQKTSSLNDYMQSDNLEKSIDNPISYYYAQYPQNSNSATETNNWKETIPQLKEKYFYKDNPNSEIENSANVKNVQSMYRDRRGLFLRPYSQGYSGYNKYNSGYNKKFPSKDHSYSNMHDSYGYGGGHKLYPGGNKHYGMGY